MVWTGAWTDTVWWDGVTERDIEVDAPVVPSIVLFHPYVTYSANGMTGRHRARVDSGWITIDAVRDRA